eukprot:3349558-Pleurochrysis_carterae.AAC.1
MSSLGGSLPHFFPYPCRPTLRAIGGSPPSMASSAALADASNLTKQFDAVLSRVLLEPKMGEPPRQPEDY